MIVVARDLSGHVGARKDGYKCHGGFGYGARNEDGERIFEYACSHDLVITNVTFRCCNERSAKICSMDFAVDDVMLASDDRNELEVLVQAWSDRLAQFGLRLIVRKTECLSIKVNDPGTITIEDTELVRVSTFKYVGSTIACNGDLNGEVNARINSAWTKWRASTGVLCDSKIPERLKSKIYWTVLCTELSADLPPKKLSAASA
ncbi:unnamed protein product [Nippostrongylus brasiliensis]|uniref:Reverse transcriptase domain-containing protein n=1 Tax=Nippostrongylus brasiliensis TaxID=27835 RepID=A0A0N4Y181_NIPBR|nr:unnamed protein product [Nippostrongylus brasiliensis]